MIDGHNHALVSLTGKNERARSSLPMREYFPPLQLGPTRGLGLVVGGDRAYALPKTLGPWAGTLDMLDRLLTGLEERTDSVLVIRDGHDLQKLLQGTIGFLLHIEGTLPLFDAPFDDPAVALRILHRLGVRSIQLIDLRSNPVLGDKAELTAVGRKLVDDIGRLRMVLDLSHMTGDEPAFRESIERASAPVVVSHHALGSVSGTGDGLTDSAARRIAATGGVVGVTVGARSLAKPDSQATVETWLFHVDHLVDLVGVNHASVGSDWIDAQRLGFPTDLFMKGFTGPHSLALLDEALDARGYSDADRRAIMGDNWLRVWAAALDNMSSE